MTPPTFPAPQQGEPFVLTDAAGRTFLSSAPVPAPLPIQAQTVQPYPCGHAPAPVSRPQGISPAAMLAVGAVGALVVGTVLVALLLSIAVVAASVATCALAITVCAVVLRSMASQPAPRGRYRRR
ncbi:SpdD-like protein [Streptomyces sp. NPDC006530]|uniref:SpdD-like protein n=1 Tax=Streptomyces sp. NPDC006530 TaxID=3364750 RepID=UPI0036C406DC